MILVHRANRRFFRCMCPACWWASGRIGCHGFGAVSAVSVRYGEIEDRLPSYDTGPSDHHSEFRGRGRTAPAITNASRPTFCRVTLLGAFSLRFPGVACGRRDLHGIAIFAGWLVKAREFGAILGAFVAVAGWKRAATIVGLATLQGLTIVLL